MLKRFCAVLFVAIVFLSCLSFANAQGKSAAPRITKAESQEAQELAKRFSTRFLESKDLALLLNEFYFNDFIDCFKKFESSERQSESNIVFVPGVFYDSKVIAASRSEDLRRFYVSAHNFILFGFVAALKDAKVNPGKETNFDIIKFYSPGVVELLAGNPNLANTIVKKGDSKIISSTEEMRSATATLEQALSVLRKRQSKTPLLLMNSNDWAKVMTNDYFKPTLELADEEIFGFPKNTRFIYVKTLIGMQLLLANDKNKLKIVWASISLD